LTNTNISPPLDRVNSDSTQLESKEKLKEERILSSSKTDQKKTKASLSKYSNKTLKSPINIPGQNKPSIFSPK
jgi:hypothetical protein